MFMSPRRDTASGALFVQPINAPVSAKKRRQGSPKSTTGCLTCRVRRVKCDEKKPYCQRCTSTGRRCEGPVVQDFRFVEETSFEMKNRASALVAERRLSTTPFQRDERRTFDYYLHRAAPILSGDLNSSVWSILIPQLSQSDAAVWNAMLAISSLFEYPSKASVSSQPNKVPSMPDPHLQYALKCYDRAIASFRIRIEQNKHDTGTALLSCVLFICIESQQDNISNAMALFGKGIQLLSSAFAPSKKSSEGLSDAAAIDAVITPFFSRHAVIATIFGQPLSPDWLGSSANSKALEIDSTSFSTLQEARDCLFRLMYQTYAIVRVAQLRILDPITTKGLIHQQHAVSSKLEDWDTAFLHLDRKSGCKTNPETTCASSNLLMYHAVSVISLSTCLSLDQTVFDAHHTRFQSIVQYAETALAPGDLPTNLSPQSSSFEMDITPPLYFVATKCRHPKIRRRALSLLRMAPQKETLWKVLPTVKIVEKTIEIEEEGLETLASSPSLLGEEILPDERKRIHHLEIIRHPTSGSEHRFSINFARYTQHADGSRHIKEQIVAI